VLESLANFFKAGLLGGAPCLTHRSSSFATVFRADAAKGHRRRKGATHEQFENILQYSSWGNWLHPGHTIFSHRVYPLHYHAKVDGSGEIPNILMISLCTAVTSVAVSWMVLPTLTFPTLIHEDHPVQAEAALQVTDHGSHRGLVWEITLF
jgi:hypothetical protein